MVQRAAFDRHRGRDGPPPGPDHEPADRQGPRVRRLTAGDARERWNRRYRERGVRALERAPSAWLVQQRALLTEAGGRRALDVACGDGRTAGYLAQLGLEGMPLQSVGAPDVRGQIEIHPSFEPGRLDLREFTHLHVIAHLHRGAPGGLTVVPSLDDTRHGIFATRSPRHPNPIGLSVVRLLAIRGATLEIAGVDLLDGTPVLDLKPYVPVFDSVAAERTGWLERAAHRVYEVRADARFDEAPPGPSSD